MGNSGSVTRNKVFRNCLVTGCAGFIGFHLARRLLAEGKQVFGLDNMNDYYDVGLKRARLAQLTGLDGFRFVQADLRDRPRIEALFREESFECVLHLAGQAGVRYSLTNPHAYVESNLVGFANILEGCRYARVQHLVFASSSSVYGANTRMPYSVEQNVDHPISLYAATKKANELMAHAYAHLYRLPSTGLRFFTVYGPWGRPDMAYFIFTKAILEGAPIQVFNHGKMSRDMTYVDDVVEGVVRIMERVPQPNAKWDGASPDPGTSLAPYRIFNIGNSQPVELIDLIACLESELGRKAKRVLEPMMDGDVPSTFADVSDLEREIGYRPVTPLAEGIARFVSWYLDYYHHEKPSRAGTKQGSARLAG